jgi:ubiquitin-like modifier-activating enzyme ATG7
MSSVHFLPPTSTIDHEFWRALTSAKLNTWRLDASPQPLVGFLGPDGSTLALTAASLSTSSSPSPSSSPPPLLLRPTEVPGTLHLFNTPEAFRGADKAALIAESVRRMTVDAVGVPSSSPPISPPSSSLHFLLLAYADLKQLTFVYWMCFPALVREGAEGEVADICAGTCGGAHPLLLGPSSPSPSPSPSRLSATADQAARLHSAYAELCHAEARVGGEATAPPLPSAPLLPAALLVDDVGSDDGDGDGDRPPPLLVVTLRDRDAGGGGKAEEHPFRLCSLRAYMLERERRAGSRADRAVHAVFVGGSPHSSSSSTPATDGGALFPWSSRTALASLGARLGLRSLSAILFRPDAVQTSLCVDVRLASPSPSPHDHTLSPPTTAVGWELDDRGRARPRVARLPRTSLDPVAVSEASASLNLSLMRWRMLPELDLPLLASTRALILGCGTLGCHLARDLLAWGVRDFTLVDSGRVSLSNPVRQPLFEFADAHGGGAAAAAAAGHENGEEEAAAPPSSSSSSSSSAAAWKAHAASAALRRIHPAVRVRPVVLEIPMPGHPIPPSARAEAAKAADDLSALVAGCDVLFLLTDSRESRWLPTLLARAHGKLAVTVALGFDTLLVLRHGVRGEGKDSPSLGCYFCGDVSASAPSNTTRNRPADQLCTVSRPGVAPIACAFASELLVATLHHPRGARAPHAPEESASPLGFVPHQVRFLLASFSPVLGHTPASDACVGCSEAVVGAWREGGAEWVLGAADGTVDLEAVSGLAELKRRAEEEASGVEEDGGWDM